MERILGWLTAFAIETALYFSSDSRSRIRQIEALNELDDRLLADVNITRRQVRETSRLGDRTQLMFSARAPSQAPRKTFARPEDGSAGVNRPGCEGF